MKATHGRHYAQLVGSRLHWKFTHTELSEWNEAQIMVLDITDIIPLPVVGDIYDGVTFATPIPVPPTQEQQDVAAARANVKLKALRNMTPAQVGAFVDANVTNLAQAQDAIKTLAIAVSILARRL